MRFLLSTLFLLVPMALVAVFGMPLPLVFALLGLSIFAILAPGAGSGDRIRWFRPRSMVMAGAGLMVLLMFTLSISAHADKAVGAPKAISAVAAASAAVHYFEPGQTEYNCCATAIKAQQAVYEKANSAFKASSGSDEVAMKTALDNALRVYARVWIYNNAADFIMESVDGWDGDALVKVGDYLDKAEAEIKLLPATEKRGGGAVAMVAKNRDHLNTRLEKLGMAPKKAESATSEGEE